jgi:hypothetical protein
MIETIIKSCITCNIIHNNKQWMTRLYWDYSTTYTWQKYKTVVDLASALWEVFCFFFYHWIVHFYYCICHRIIYCTVFVPWGPLIGICTPLFWNMPPKKAKQSKPSCYFKIVFFKFLKRKKKKKKRLFKISIFPQLKVQKKFWKEDKDWKLTLDLLIS